MRLFGLSPLTSERGVVPPSIQHAGLVHLAQSPKLGSHPYVLDIVICGQVLAQRILVELRVRSGSWYRSDIYQQLDVVLLEQVRKLSH